MTDAPLRRGARYAIKHATHEARAIVDEVVDRVDVHTLRPDRDAAELGLNDIGRVRLRTSKPLAFDAYERNRATGSFILVDEASNDTVGAGMIT
jgi:bifunctional enzyme CysN/CysC